MILASVLATLSDVQPKPGAGLRRSIRCFVLSRIAGVGDMYGFPLLLWEQ